VQELSRKAPIDHAPEASLMLAPTGDRLVLVATTEMQDSPNGPPPGALLTPVSASLETHQVSLSPEQTPACAPGNETPSDEAVAAAYQSWLALLSRYTDGKFH
jgi:hypothetical protein